MDTVVLQCTEFMCDRQLKWIDIQHQVSKVWRFQACHGGNHPEQQNSLLPLSCVSLDNRIPDDRDGRALASLLAVRDDKKQAKIVLNALRQWKREERWQIYLFHRRAHWCFLLFSRKFPWRTTHSLVHTASLPEMYPKFQHANLLVVSLSISHRSFTTGFT